MSSFAEWLAERVEEEATLPARVVLRKFKELAVSGGPEYMTTVEAGRILGYSPKRWRVWCEDGAIEGAWQDSANGRWRLPLASARAHLLRLQNQKRTPRKSRRRGPNKAPSAHPAFTRSPRLQAGPVLALRSQELG